MKLIETILLEITDSSIPLSDILRKFKILANILKNEQLEKWIEHELNGYDDISKLPDYRIIHINAKGIFRNSAYQLTSHIAPISLDEKYKFWAETAYIREPIISIENLANNDDPTVKAQWPPDLIAFLQDKELVQGYYLMDAWQEISIGQLLSILNIVRTKVLDFILELKSSIPELENFDFTSTSNDNQQKIASQVTSNYFGDFTGNIAIGSTGITQKIDTNINKSDISALKTELSKLGIPESDLLELEKAIKQDKDIVESNTLGKNVSNWIGKILAKGGQLFKGISLSVVSKLITELILKYYGF